MGAHNLFIVPTCYATHDPEIRTSKRTWQLNFWTKSFPWLRIAKKNAKPSFPTSAVFPLYPGKGNAKSERKQRKIKTDAGVAFFYATLHSVFNAHAVKCKNPSALIPADMLRKPGSSGRQQAIVFCSSSYRYLQFLSPGVFVWSSFACVLTVFFTTVVVIDGITPKKNHAKWNMKLCNFYFWLGPVRSFSIRFFFF